MIELQNLIQSGLRLIPIPFGKKAPNTKNWNRFENTIGCLEKLPLLEGKNVGLVHAYCAPTATCAIDIDDLNYASPWLTKQGVPLNSLIEDERSVVISSGKSNSLKLIYRLPDKIAHHASEQIKGPNGSMMIEFRCASKDGRSLHDLIPPSMHPSGSRYTWIGRGSPLNIPTIPSQLLDLWKNLEAEKSRTTANQSKINRRPHLLGVIKSSRAETPRAVAELEMMLSHIDPSCDYCTWRNIVWGVLSTGWNSANTIARKWSASAPERYSEASFNELVRSFNSTFEDRPTLGTVLFHARQGGWRG